MAKTATSGATPTEDGVKPPKDIGDLKARVERLELQAREAEARLRTFEAKARLEELKAANPPPAKSA